MSPCRSAMPKHNCQFITYVNVIQLRNKVKYKSCEMTVVIAFYDNMMGDYHFVALGASPTNGTIPQYLGVALLLDWVGIIVFYQHYYYRSICDRICERGHPLTSKPITCYSSKIQARIFHHSFIHVSIPCTENCKLIALTHVKLLIVEVSKFDVGGIRSHISAVYMCLCLCSIVLVHHCQFIHLLKVVYLCLRKMKHLDKVITYLWLQLSC